MIKIKVPNGGDNPPKQLTPEQMQAWNQYVDYLEKKGYKGHKDLDKKETGLAKKLMDNFIKENPGTPLTYDDVKSVQLEMQKVKDQVQAFAARRNDPNASKAMAGISTVDGWPGSKTTSFKFPAVVQNNYHNDKLVGSENLGLVSGNGIGNPLLAGRKQLPPGVTLEKMYNPDKTFAGMGYQDPKTGDIVMFNQ